MMVNNEIFDLFKEEMVEISKNLQRINQGFTQLRINPKVYVAIITGKLALNVRPTKMT